VRQAEKCGVVWQSRPWDIGGLLEQSSAGTDADLGLIAAQPRQSGHSGRATARTSSTAAYCALGEWRGYLLIRFSATVNCHQRLVIHAADQTDALAPAANDRPSAPGSIRFGQYQICRCRAEYM
jgi:hypothetical protein